jgi:hypothetical protein
MIYAPEQRKFGRNTRDTLTDYCKACSYRFACNGDCPKNRFTNTPTASPVSVTFARESSDSSGTPTPTSATSPRGSSSAQTRSRRFSQSQSFTRERLVKRIG